MKPAITLLIGLFLLCGNLLAQKLPKKVAKYVSYDAPLLALTNAIIYDGTGAAPRSGQTILIKEGKISVVGDLKNFRLPKGYKTIDLTGKTVIPGLVMMHEHMIYPTHADDFYHLSEMLLSFPKLYLAGGATTIRTAGGSGPRVELNLAAMIDSGQVVGPKIHVTSQHISRRSEMPILALDYINKSNDIIEIMDYWGKRGISSYKLYMNLTREDLQVAVKKAKEKQYHVTAHLCAVTYAEAAKIGIHNLEHGFMASTDFLESKIVDNCNSIGGRKALMSLDKDSPKMKQLMKTLIASGVTITSTLPVFEPYTGREIIPGGGLDAVAPMLRDRIMRIWSSKQNQDQDDEALFKKEMYWEKMFFDMGGRLTNGTDPTYVGRTVAGYANQRSIELLVEAGFTTEQAIMISTKNGAEFLGVINRKGTLQKGKNADLVIINGDLRDDISIIRKMETVFKDGIGYNSEKLFKAAEGQVGIH